MCVFRKRNILCGFVIVLILSGIAFAAPKQYEATVTEKERAAIHSRIEALSADLINTMLFGATYDSISYGSGSGGTGGAGTAYPFPVANTTANRNEGLRKTAKLTWAVEHAKSFGFLNVVHYQPYNYIYAEIGDADAPEMVMAMSHLDSPPASISVYNSPRWVDETGALNPLAYKMPYVKDGWIYGCGIQDDSGPTLATLVSMKAIMDAKLPFDRRIRVLMGVYEDNNPGIPTVANTLTYADIPYHTVASGFYDNWAYKYLNREEIPIASYTADSRFPVTMGTSSSNERSVMFDLSSDDSKGFRLVAADMHVTTRPNEPTIIDIIGASGNHIPSQSRVRLSVDGVSPTVVSAFKNAVQAEVDAKGWVGKVTIEDISSDIRITANTHKPVDAVTPYYGHNGIVWVMHLVSKGFAAISASYPDINSLKLKQLADGVDALFMPNGVEDCFGTAMGLYERHPDSEVAMMTISFGLLVQASSSNYNIVYDPQPLYPVNVNTSSPTASFPNRFVVRVFARSMYSTSAEYVAAHQKMVDAFNSKGWTVVTGTYSYLGSSYSNAATPSYSAPTISLQHDNILYRVLMASYRNSVAAPAGMEDLKELLGVTYPTGSTGGNFSQDYFNKMTCFGAILPGNERWFHTANERMRVGAAIQTGKICADAMVEMARYIGPAGAQVMWADIPGYNPNRADLDLLDVVLDTYRDASGAVPASALGGQTLAAATAFEIPMQVSRFSGNRSVTAMAAGHGSGGVYLPLNNADYLANNFVLPMRLEFKLTKKALGMDGVAWNALKNSSIPEILSKAKFGIVRDGAPVVLTVPGSMPAEKFFFKRVSARDPNSLYISINVAIADGDTDLTPKAILANSTPDLFRLNPAFVAANGFPPEMKGRGEVTERGFFLMGDGVKDARFISPEAIYMTLDTAAFFAEPTAPFDPPFDGKNPANETDFPNNGASVEARQDSTGDVTVAVTVDPDCLSDGEWLTFFFYSEGNYDPAAAILKQVFETAPGVFEAEFDYAELISEGLVAGAYAVHFSNADGSVVGYSTFTNGALQFKTTGKPDLPCDPCSGCNAGYAGILVLVAALLLGGRKITRR